MLSLVDQNSASVINRLAALFLRQFPLTRIIMTKEGIRETEKVMLKNWSFCVVTLLGGCDYVTLPACEF